MVRYFSVVTSLESLCPGLACSVPPIVSNSASPKHVHPCLHQSQLLRTFLLGEWSLMVSGLPLFQPRVFLASSWSLSLAGLVPLVVPLALHQPPAPLRLCPGTPAHTESAFLPLALPARGPRVCLALWLSFQSPPGSALLCDSFCCAPCPRPHPSTFCVGHEGESPRKRRILEGNVTCPRHCQ